jgi:hypothetical protein
MSAARVVAAVAALTAALGCSRAKLQAPACSTDDHCGGGLACVGGECIPFAAAPQGWAVDISPLPEAPASFTELASMALAGSALNVTASAKASVAISFTLEAPSAALSRAHVVLTVPSAIPGRPDLTFETNLPESAVAGVVPPVTLPVPADVIGRQGTLQILPTAPDNLTHAPSRYEVTVATALLVALPAKVITIRGRLLSAVGDPREGFTARAFFHAGGALVSNAAVTDKDGVFSLMVPAGLATDAPLVSVDVTPPTDGPADPWLSVKAFPLTAGKDLGDLKLPPFSQANVFRFVAHGGAAEGPAVARAIVRAHAALAETTDGTFTSATEFQSDGLTDAAGRASLELLPGSTAELRNYDLTVIPPAGSPYGLRCIAKFPLSVGGTAEAPANVPGIELPRRPVLAGTVTGSDGAPAVGVVILATRSAADAATSCPGDVGASPATTTTDDHGHYELPLDPGVYQIDYDPPARAPVPRLTETGIIVPGAEAAGDGGVGQVSHTVQLPAGVVIEGTTRDSTGGVLPLAGVRLYQVACTSTETCSGPGRVAPILRAQARSDATGHFRAVVAAP